MNLLQMHVSLPLLDPALIDLVMEAFAIIMLIFNLKTTFNIQFFFVFSNKFDLIGL